MIASRKIMRGSALPFFSFPPSLLSPYYLPVQCSGHESLFVPSQTGLVCLCVRFLYFKCLNNKLHQLINYVLLILFLFSSLHCFISIMFPSDFSTAHDYLAQMINHSRLVAAHHQATAAAGQSTHGHYNGTAASSDAALMAAAAAYSQAQQEAIFRSPSTGGLFPSGGRKRALSASPFSEVFDLNSMIRNSPNSLNLFNAASRSSSASGSYGHLSAGAISPSLNPHLHHFMRSPVFMPPSFGSNSSLSGQTSAFTPHHHAAAASFFNHHSKRDSEGSLGVFHRETASNVVSSTVDEIGERSRSSRHNGSTVTSNVGMSDNTLSRTMSNGNSRVTARTLSERGDDDRDLEETGDVVIETNCQWVACSREFKTQAELVKHIDDDHIKMNKKAFICEWRECSRDRKPFKAQYMLVVHMRRHTGEKPHKCPFDTCTKAYSRLENLKTHIRSHTGEKPYHCEFPGCQKAFSNASDRAKHQNRTHSNEKPYACKIPGCLKRYTDPSSLRKHVKTVHGPDAYANKKHKGHSSGPPDNDHDTDTRSPAIKPDPESNLSPISSPPATSPSTSSPSEEENMRSPDNSGPSDGIMDAPISDNNVSSTCIGQPSSSIEMTEWLGGGDVDEPESSSDFASPRIPISAAIALGGGGGAEDDEYGRGPSLAFLPGKAKGNIKDRIKSSLKTAKNWIVPNVFGNKLASKPSHGLKNPSKDGRSNLVRQGSCASSVNSFYSSLMESEEVSQATTSSSTSYSTATAPIQSKSSSQMARCSSYDPMILSPRKSAPANGPGCTKQKISASQAHKARHLSQTENLMVQPRSAALSSGISSEGYGSSLSTLNSTTSLTFSTSDQVRPDTGSGSNSTTITVATQIHHPNENVALDECDSDQPIELHPDICLPDDAVQFLDANTDTSSSVPVPVASSTSLQPRPPPPSSASSSSSSQMPNSALPPGPLSPNSTVTQPSPSSISGPSHQSQGLTMLRTPGSNAIQPSPFSPMQVDSPQITRTTEATIHDNSQIIDQKPSASQLSAAASSLAGASGSLVPPPPYNSNPNQSPSNKNSNQHTFPNGSCVAPNAGPRGSGHVEQNYQNQQHHYFQQQQQYYQQQMQNHWHQQHQPQQQFMYPSINHQQHQQQQGHPSTSNNQYSSTASSYYGMVQHHQQQQQTYQTNQDNLQSRTSSQFQRIQDQRVFPTVQQTPGSSSSSSLPLSAPSSSSSTSNNFHPPHIYTPQTADLNNRSSQQVNPYHQMVGNHYYFGGGGDQRTNMGANSYRFETNYNRNPNVVAQSTGPSNNNNNYYPETRTTSSISCRTSSRTGSATNQSNMVVNDMNSTLTSLVEETRFLKMTNN